MPLIVSAGDDRLIKLWRMSETKAVRNILPRLENLVAHSLLTCTLVGG